ncbi:sulfurtransferase complex subunit TusD [Aliiglaciecola lipolytica]|uniref:sulfurtransferase complex subunit TusD n=1 Tax=Aliiglaciecola lipolytica TaxID=477689 RepID=UPI001C0949A1|nr:sulfurtransferase complex subunit TusD [Aliiglaciecola lipolytica]MBU2876397.1 sulfurtransferase complex subunit TusD [Aliiglaciecola lipolytica]
MASFCIIVTSSPLESQDCYSAYRFVQAAIEDGHSISGVFFYQSGVELANSFQTMLSDELAIYPKWCELADKHAIPLQVCVTAANRRGILSEQDSLQNDTPALFNLNPPFQSVGIGELVSMLNESDRSIQF